MTCVGYEVELKMKAGGVVKGVVWNANSQNGTVVLTAQPEAPGSHTPTNATLVYTAAISTIVSAKPPTAPVAPVSLKQLDLTKVLAREQKAVEAMERQIRSIGVGVTEQAQAIFDTLIKTMPCEWAGHVIEVYGLVRIPPPYTVDVCTFMEGAKHEDRVMERVVTVLGGELERITAEDAEQ